MKIIDMYRKTKFKMKHKIARSANIANIMHNYAQTGVSVYNFGKGTHKQDKIAYPIHQVLHY